MKIKYEKPSVIHGDYNFNVPAHLNYGKFVLDSFEISKEKVALINGLTDEKISYGELVRRVRSAVASLKQMDVGIGDVVGICSENRVEVITTAIAAFYAGATVTFINSAYSKDELMHTLNISKPGLIFLSPKTCNNYYETLKNMDFIYKKIVFGNEKVHENVIIFENITISDVDNNPYDAVDFNGLEQTALILYSSGTTGLPKGAKLSHRNLILAGLQPSFRSVKDNGVLLSLAPWANTFGSILTLKELADNQTIVYLNKFIEDIYLKCIEKYQVEVLLTVPPLVVILSQSKIIENYNVSSVELMYCGGAPLNKGVITEAKKKFKNMKHILQGYGMTEATGAVTEETESKSKVGSVGRVKQGITIKIVHLDSRVTLGPYQTGEVCIKGPLLFQGYIGRDLKEEQDEESFYKTGDIAYYDEDGFFYIVDRIKELIKYKAGQVAPSELEGILRLHPAVQDVGVTGAPDPLVGELPTAFVVKNPQHKITEQELVNFVAAKVSSWKQLRGGVKFVQQIPKTASGKILRRQLRKLLTEPASKI